MGCSWPLVSYKKGLSTHARRKILKNNILIKYMYTFAYIN